MNHIERRRGGACLKVVGHLPQGGPASPRGPLVSMGASISSRIRTSTSIGTRISSGSSSSIINSSSSSRRGSSSSSSSSPCCSSASMCVLCV